MCTFSIKIDDFVRNPKVVVLETSIVKLQEFQSVSPLNVHSIVGVGLAFIVRINWIEVFASAVTCEGVYCLVCSRNGLTENKQCDVKYNGYIKLSIFYEKDENGMILKQNFYLLSYVVYLIEGEIVFFNDQSNILSVMFLKAISNVETKTKNNEKTNIFFKIIKYKTSITTYYLK